MPYCGLPWWLGGKESACNTGNHPQFRRCRPREGLDDLLEKGMATHSSILAGKSHGQRSLMGGSPWGRKRIRHDLATKPTPSHTASLLARDCLKWLVEIW